MSDQDFEIIDTKPPSELAIRLVKAYGGDNFIQLAASAEPWELAPENLPELKRRLADDLGEAILSQLTPVVERPADGGMCTVRLGFWLLTPAQMENLVEVVHGDGAIGELTPDQVG